jgi:DNA-binding transcriptional LysR family regulator
VADELDGIAIFVALAETRGFRAAAERLNISHSAVSQTVRRLEDRLGVALVQRSTRSVRLTEAGERLYSSVRPAMDEVRAAVAAIGEFGDAPRGTLRLHTSPAVVSLFGDSFLVGFLTEHPHIRLDLVVSDSPVDIIEGGYDAGIQLGEVIDKDMIAVPVSGDIRFAVVASPEYFKRRGIPKHPRELTEHDCLNWHPAADAPSYRWEFTEDGREFSVTVMERVLSTDAAINRRLVKAGLGITLALEEHVREALTLGEMQRVLEEFCEPFPGYYLYYPQRRQASRALRALVEHIRKWRSQRSTGKEL